MSLILSSVIFFSCNCATIYRKVLNRATIKRRSRSSSLFCSSFSIRISISVGSICGILSESAILFAHLAFFGAGMLGRLFIIAARLCHYPLSNTFAEGVQFIHGLRFLFRRVESLPIHAGSAPTGIFYHSPNSETTRAAGASENELQGADFPLLALLLRLYDSSLQMTHVAIGSLPVDGTPVNGLTQARASCAYRRGFKFPTNSCSLHHCHRVS